MRTYTTVDAYLDALDDRRKVALQQLRRIILETVPDAQESIQYNMSAYAYHGMLCAFASQKRYISFYVLDRAMVDLHRDLLKGLSVGKGCIRFRSTRCPRRRCARCSRRSLPPTSWRPTIRAERYVRASHAKRRVSSAGG